MQLKLLADESIDYRIIKYLRKKEFEIISILEDCPGSSDKQVLSISINNEAILLTEDKDFGTWIFSHKFKSIGIIYLRYDISQLTQIISDLNKLLVQYESSLYNKFVVLTINKLRIRDLP